MLDHRYHLVALLFAGTVAACSSSSGFAPSAKTSLPAARPRVTIAEYRLAKNARPDLIAMGADGAMWFTESGTNAIARIAAGAPTPNPHNTATPNPGIAEYRIPTAKSRPIGITAAPDRAMWFTQFETGQIGRIALDARVKNPRITEYAAGQRQPLGIASGPQRSLWFGTYPGNTATRMTLRGTVTATYATKLQHVANFVEAPDHAMWFTQCAPPGMIGRIAANGKLSQRPVPTTIGRKPQPLYPAVGPDGNVWFTDRGTDAIGKATVTGSGIGAIVEIALPKVGASRPEPLAITAGPGSALWFTATTPTRQAYIGRIPADAERTADITLYRVPTPNDKLWGIARGSANTLWFTECAGLLGAVHVGG